MKTPVKALKIVQQFYPQIKLVEDSDNNVVIEVTPKDEKTSKLKSHSECALALACKRQLHADGVIISVRTAYVVFGEKALRFRVPEATAREIVAFDRNGGFYPGTYKLKKPCKTERLDYRISGRTHKPSGRKNGKFRHVTHGIRTSLHI